MDLEEETVKRKTSELEEMMKAVVEREKKLELLEAYLSDRFDALEETKKEIKLKEETVKRKTSELEEMMKAVVEREKKVKFSEDCVLGRYDELKMKEKEFEMKENERRERLSELEKKEEKKQEEARKIDESVIKLALMREQLEKIIAPKRSRLEVGTSSSTDKVRYADYVIPTGKKHKYVIREHNHNDEERDREVRKYDSQSVIDEVICIDSDDETKHELYTCPDPEFYHFKKTMESLSVGQSEHTSKAKTTETDAVVCIDSDDEEDSHPCMNELSKMAST